MPTHRDMLDWIDGQDARMRSLVSELAAINSGTSNLTGLARMADVLALEFAALGAPVERIGLPPRVEIDVRGHATASPLGQALRWRKPAARVKSSAKRVFLGIHYDTVYAADHPFQSCEQVDENTLRGPGVADAKGGIVVLLTALAAIERGAVRERVAWEVLLNPDEEIGSPGSLSLLRDAAGRNDVGLVFEPALEDGALAGARKGSGNFTLVVRGRSAHVGRHPEKGRNAIHAAAAFIRVMDGWFRGRPGVVFNVGRIDGGGPANVVADVAVVRFNCRADTPERQQEIESILAAELEGLGALDGITAELHGSFTSPPKPLNDHFLALLELARDCGRELGLELRWRDTGGVCDGNKLAAAGLANIDTLGPRGGGLHSDGEFLLLDSLTERAKLAALVIARIAG